MKKIFILLIFSLSILSLKAQTVIYPPNTAFGTFDSIKVPVTDTVYSLSKIGDISGYYSVWEFDMSRLDSSVSVNPGGGSRIIRNSPRLYSFNPIIADSLPYTLPRLKWKTTTNGVTQNTKALPIIIHFDYEYAAIKVKRLGCTAGKYLLFRVNFHR